MFTIKTLHMIATTIFLDAYVTPWAVLSVSTYIIRCLTIIGAFRQPTPNSIAVSRGVVVGAAFKTKVLLIRGIELSCGLLGDNDNRFYLV